jgi:UDP-glucose 4-epimerase
MARCLVTGYRGYIGSALFSKLESLGHEVRGVDLICKKRPVDIRSKEFFSSDYWNDFKPEFIFHLAAFPSVQYSVQNPSLSLSNNVCGTSTILEFAKNVGAKRVIFSSSAAVYGNDGTPSNPYGLHKLMSEMECKLYSELYDLDTVSLRYFNVFSENQIFGGPYSTVITAWRWALRNNKPLIIHGDGQQTRDFIHLDDIVDCNVFCMNYENNFKGQHCDVGNGVSLSLSDLKKIISKIKKCNWIYENERVGDVKKSCADISQLTKMGWIPKTNTTNSIKQIFGG